MRGEIPIDFEEWKKRNTPKVETAISEPTGTVSSETGKEITV